MCYQPALVILLFLLGLPLYSQNQPAPSLLQEGESLIFEDPYRGIDFLNKALKRLPAMPDSTVASIHSLMGTAYAIIGKLDSARQYMTLAINKLPNGEKRVLAMKNLASVFRIQQQYEAADSIFTDIFNSISDVPANRNLMAMMQGEHTSIFTDRGQNRTAIEMLKRGLFLCESAPRPDTTTLSILKNKLATIYMNIDEYSLAAFELESILQLKIPINNLYHYCSTTSMLARAYIELGQPDRAFNLLGKSLNAAKKLNNKELQGFVLMLYGQYYDLKGKRQEALQRFNEAFTHLKSVESVLMTDCATACLNFLRRYDMIEEGIRIIRDPFVQKQLQSSTLADVLKFKRAALGIYEEGDYQRQLLESYREIIPMIDSVTRMKLDQSLIDSKAEFRFKHQEQEKQQLEQKNKLLEQQQVIRSAQTSFIITSLIALLLLIAYLVLRYRNRSLIQQQELERSRHEIKIKENRLEWEVQVRSLREKVIEQQKTDLLKKVDQIDQLKVELEKATEESQKQIEGVLIRELADSKNKIGLEQFLKQFNSIFPNFFSELSKKYPELSTSDLQFCALLRLNLSIKDISRILRIEPKSTYQKKYRIEEKMSLTKGTGLEQAVFLVPG